MINHLLQKPAFETVYSRLPSCNLGAFVMPDGLYTLCFSIQCNYYHLGAQRGGLRRFRSLDTLQKYVFDDLQVSSYSVNLWPDRFPIFDGCHGLPSVAA